MDDWDDDFAEAPAQGGAADPLVATEYTRMEQRYTDAGYREGITEGKLSTLQTGFDQSFAASVPRARRLGQLRGRANALLAISLSSSTSTSTSTPAGAARRARVRASASPSVSPPPRARQSLSPTPTSPARTPAAAAASSELVDTIRTLVADLATVRRDAVLAPDLERIAHEQEEHADNPDDEYAFELAPTDAREMDALEVAMGGMGGRKDQGLREEALLEALEGRVRAVEERVFG